MGCKKFPQPIKDWKNIKNYPIPKNTSKNQWAWEFLRRNPDYQEDYSEYKDSPPDLMMDGEFIDPQNPLLTKKLELKTYIQTRYGVCRGVLIDPAIDSPGKIFQYKTSEIQGVFPNNFWEQSKGEYTWKPKHHLQLAIVFDLSCSLQEQINAAKKIFNNKKEFFKDQLLLGKSRPDKYVEYLRLLDAKYSDASVIEMKTISSSVIDNADQWVYDSLKRAEELSQSQIVI